jgi:hypothetical protein
VYGFRKTLQFVLKEYQLGFLTYFFFLQRFLESEICCAQQTGMHICCGSTAYSVETVYGGKGHLYTPGVRPALLATPCLASLATICLASLATICLASLATPRRFTGDHPDRPVDHAQLATPC